MAELGQKTPTGDYDEIIFLNVWRKFREFHLHSDEMNRVFCSMCWSETLEQCGQMVRFFPYLAICKNDN